MRGALQMLKIRYIMLGAFLLVCCHLLIGYFGLHNKYHGQATKAVNKNEDRYIEKRNKIKKKNNFLLLRLKNKQLLEKPKVADVAKSIPKAKRIPAQKNGSETYEHLLDWSYPLKGSMQSPKPAFKLGDVGGHADFIIGIPSVKRFGGDYLMATLRSLLKNRRSKTATFKIVVFIGELDQTYVKRRAQQIYNAFTRQFKQGKMQVISPPKEYYPDWNAAITNTLDDTLDRVKWRSKENLDAVFVMMYIYQLSTKYYIMLEDDVLSDEGYDLVIEDNARRLAQSEWFFVSFCGCGSIGKLFKKKSIPSCASFLHNFWNKKPIDWLLSDYSRTAYCANDGNEDGCQSELDRRLPHVTPYVFHHSGTYSSLKGKAHPADQFC